MVSFRPPDLTLHLATANTERASPRLLGALINALFQFADLLRAHKPAIGRRSGSSVPFATGILQGMLLSLVLQAADLSSSCGMDMS